MKALYTGIVLCGIFSLASLEIRGIPPDRVNRTMVEIDIPGLGAGYLFESLLSPMEKALIRIEGVKVLYSAVFDGGMMFQLETARGTSPLAEIRRSIRNLRRQFPFQAGIPRISSLPGTGCTADFVFGVEEGQSEIIAQNMRALREELLRLEAIHSVTLQGIPDREVVVRLDPAGLSAARLSPVSVKEALEQSFFEMNAGTSEGPLRRSDLVLSSGVDTLEALQSLSLPLVRKGSWEHYSLGEVAEVAWSPPLFGGRVFFHGEQGGMASLRFAAGSGLFERFRAAGSAAQIIASREWITGFHPIGTSLTKSISPIMFLLFSILAAGLLLYPEGSILQTGAPPSLLLTLYAFFHWPLGPDVLIGMGHSVIVAGAVLLTGRLGGNSRSNGAQLPPGRLREGLPTLLLPLLLLFSASLPLTWDLSYGMRRYAIVNTASSNTVEKGGFSFIIDYPQGPPEAVLFQREHWLSRIDPDFFIVGIESPASPEHFFGNGNFIPLDESGNLSVLWEAVSSSPVENLRLRRESKKTYSLERSVLELDSGRLTGAGLSRRTVLRHLEMALRGVEVGRIRGPLDGRYHTVRLLYGNCENPENATAFLESGEGAPFSGLPVFPGDALPVSLGEISSLSRKREDVLFFSLIHHGN